MKKIWWLIGILVLLLLVSGFREGFDTAGITDAKCPDGSSPPISDFKCVGTDNRPTCPSGSSLYTVFKRGEGVPKLSCVPNSLIYDGTWTDGERTQTPCKSATDSTGLPVPPTGPPPLEMPKCISNPSSATSGTSGTTSGTRTANTMTATTTGTSTGGSSTSSLGPNSGGGRRGQVFGPTFSGMGDGDGKVRPMDSSKTNNYPELLGGGDSKPSTRIDGAGIVDPSKNWQLANNGSLPSSASLGSDENSKYFPYSRQPGDMELIPDPYRVSQQFSSASYSFKTEPTPFLTDFSAFLR